MTANKGTWSYQVLFFALLTTPKKHLLADYQPFT